MSGAVFDPGNPETTTLAVVELAIMRRIRKIRDFTKSLVRCARRLHSGEHTDFDCAGRDLPATSVDFF